MKFKFNKKQIPYFIITFFGIVLFVMGIANHYYFRTVTYDYGNYNFAFWDYSHFRISPMPTYAGNFLQDHFSFTLMYFIPVYWLINWLTGTYTLIIIQYSLVLIASWFTYMLIAQKTNNLWLTIGVVFYYFILLGRYNTFSCDVNLAVISSCLIPSFIYYFEKDKYLYASIIFVLSLFSRENIPLWFIFIFIVLIIQHRKDKRAVLYSTFGIIVSIIFFILLFKVLIPSIETDEKQFTLFNYSALGATPGKALMFILQNPVETIKLFFVNHLGDTAYDGVKAEFYIVYLVSGGIVLVLRPQYLIWFIPIVAQKVLNDSFIRWGISNYYSIEVVTLLPLSVFLTLASMKSKYIQNGLTVVICVATLGMTIYKLDQSNVIIPWTLNPSKEKIYSKSFFRAQFNIKKVNKLIKQIPKKARVSASDHLFSHLSQRQSIYLFPTVKDAEYIIFSVFDDYFMISHEENEKSRNQYLFDPKWEIVAQEYPVFLLKSKTSLTSNKGSIDSKLKLQTDTLFCDYETIDFTNYQALFNNNSKAENTAHVTDEKPFSGKNSLKLRPEIPYSNSYTFNDLSKISYLQISAWSYNADKKAHIVATSGNEFYMVSNDEETDSLGWGKISLSFWLPEKLNAETFKIYLWNSGQEPVYFDDLQIVKMYKNK